MESTQTGREDAVSAAVESLHNAMIAGDKDALDELALPELSYGHSNGYLENKAKFIETLTNGTTRLTAIELSRQTINVVQEVALVRHVFKGTRHDGTTLRLSILTVWLQQREQWKLLARQAVKRPVTDQTLR